MRSVRLASSLVALAGLIVSPATAWGQADWPNYGGNAWNQRWSSLKQISTTNVDRLVPRMVFQTNVSRPGSFENTPIVVGNMMYVSTAYNEATIAYDLSSGKQVWRYEPCFQTAACPACRSQLNLDRAQHPRHPAHRPLPPLPNPPRPREDCWQTRWAPMARLYHPGQHRSPHDCLEARLGVNAPSETAATSVAARRRD